MQEKIVLLSFIFLIAIVLVICFWLLDKKKDRKLKIDYYSMFILGICWFILGIIFNEKFSLLVGTVFAIMGLFNKKHWVIHFVKPKFSQKKDLFLFIIICLCTILLILITLYLLNI